MLRTQPASAVIDQIGKADDGVLGDVAVAGDVVAAHDREGRVPSARRRLQAGKDQAEGGFWRARMRGVAGDVGMGGIELLAGRVDVVAALGDGQRDDADGRIGQPIR